MTYKLTKAVPGLSDGQKVIRLTDGVFIPFDPANIDYQKYLEWVAEGNTPLPAEE